MGPAGPRTGKVSQGWHSAGGPIGHLCGVGQADRRRSRHGHAAMRGVLQIDDLHCHILQGYGFRYLERLAAIWLIL